MAKLSFYQKFKIQFPESVSFLEEKETECILDADDGDHILFAFSVVPYVKQIISGEESEAVKRIASFFETMARDKSGSNVLQVTVLESLVDGETYEDFKKWNDIWGDTILGYIPSIEKYMRIGA